MLGPMGVLVACCFLIGLAPLLVAPILEQGDLGLGPGPERTGPRLVALAPLDWITAMGLLLDRGSAALAGWCCGCGSAAPSSPNGATWGCGYLAPTPRMQYTSSSFAQMLVGLFGWVLRPRTHRPRDLPLFPQTGRFPQRGARRGARRGRAAGVPLRGLAVLLVPGVPAGEHPDLLAVYLPRPDRPVALALERDVMDDDHS